MFNTTEFIYFKWVSISPTKISQGVPVFTGAPLLLSRLTYICQRPILLIKKIPVQRIKNAACMKSPSEAAFIYTVYILGNCLLFLFFLQFTDLFSDFPQFIQYLIPAAGVTELMVFKYINPAIERVKKDPDYYQKKQWHHQHSEWHSASISDCTPPHDYHSFFQAY